jgi:putative DNA methylase
MREEAFKRIGHLYPKVDVKTGLPVKQGEEKPGQETATVIAWIWARTIKSPNPAFSHVEVPLASSFLLATKPGKETWVEPVIDGDKYRFVIRTSIEHGPVPAGAKNGTKLSRGANFRCILSDSPIEASYVYEEGQAGRIGARLMAVVVEGEHGRVYVTPTPETEAVGLSVVADWQPNVTMPDNPRWFSPIFTV